MLDPRPATLGTLALAVALWLATPAAAAPYEFVPVGDPLEAEIRLLDLVAADSAAGGGRLPRLHMRPLQRFELVADRSGAAGPRSIAARRIARELARDESFPAGGAPRGSTPRLIQHTWPDAARFEMSAGLEAGGDAVHGDGTSGRWQDGSGAHLRAAVQVDRWVVASHLFAAQFEGGRSFADPLVANSDFIVHTEDTYLAYTGSPRWTAAFGRGRAHWGPGEEGSLLLSRTSAPLTAATLRMRVPAMRADAMALNAVLGRAEHLQLAAHRLEWQPVDAVRVGLSEAAVYRSDSWDPLYVVGAIPYFLVQRLETQDEPDSAAAVRNNVLVSLDAAVRVADGTRLYGEYLVDDLHAKSAAYPNKYGVQLGVEGVGTVRGTRLSWGAEYTRLTRFVYTSYLGLPFVAQARALGFPTGPDSRRLRTRIAWDPGVDWQATLVAAQTDAGESGLGVVFVPGSPVPDPGRLSGVVERTREVEGTLRWWPATAVDASLRAGWARRENAAHVPGADETIWRVGAAIRLTR